MSVSPSATRPTAAPRRPSGLGGIAHKASAARAGCPVTPVASTAMAARSPVHASRGLAIRGQYTPAFKVCGIDAPHGHA